MKNEGKARARALGRLDPVKHEQYLKAERARKTKREINAESKSGARLRYLACRDPAALPREIRDTRAHFSNVII